VLGQLIHSDFNCVVLVQWLLQRPVPSHHRRVVRLSWHVELVVLQVVLVLYHLSVHLLRLLVPQLLSQHCWHLLLRVLHVKLQIVLRLRAFWAPRVLVQVTQKLLDLILLLLLMIQLRQLELVLRLQVEVCYR
jgi:hypothetical protein